MNNIKKGILFLMVLCGGLSQSQGQSDSTTVEKDTSYWSAGGINSLSFSQVSLTNWAAGGLNSVSITGYTGYFADYAKGRQTWENSVDLAYGLIRQGDADFTKSDDKINFVTKYGHQINKSSYKFFFSGLLDFKTQFTNGFSAKEPDSVISRFMAPGYLVVGLGIDYKPNKVLSFNYVPATGKFTFVMDEGLAAAGAYGVDPGSKARAELGSFLRIKYKDEMFKNVKVDSRLELFTNYVENFGNIDVNWQNTIVFKVNGWLTTNLFTQLIYDDDIKIEVDKNNDGVVDAVGPRVQFKNVFGLGITFTYGDKRKKD
ncbi:MAG: DUF3078 domain-containing protein [Bacteroidota bacterium]